MNIVRYFISLLVITLFVEVAASGNDELQSEAQMDFTNLLADNTPSPQERIRDLLNRAGVSYYESDYRKAYELLIEGLSLCEKYGDSTYEARIYANMGNIYSRFNKHDMAKRYYSRALSLYRDSVAIIATLNNLGSAELEGGNPDSAFLHIGKALDISRRQGDRYLYSIQNNIARYYVAKEKPDSALHYFLTALNNTRRDGKREKEAEILSNLSDLKFDTGQIDSALYYATLSNSLAIADNMQFIEAHNYLILSNIAQRQGEAGRALDYFKRHAALSDSLFNVETFGEINQLQRLYDASKTDAQIANLIFERQIKERTISYQRVVQSVILAAFIVVVVILMVTFRQNRKLKTAYKVLVEKNVRIIDIQSDSSPTGEKYRKSFLNHDRHGELMERILSVMEDTAVISDAKFTIDKLAELVQSNQTYVSQVINETKGKNFRSFLNSYRIEEAQRIFSHPDSAKFTIEAVARQVGFMSRTTFRNAFKEITGVEPSLYLKFIQQREHDR